MSQVFVEDYIKKIILLEKQCGAKTNYQILEPFPLNSKDIIAIQTAAKKIAEFIGLHGLTFIIAKVKLKEKVGGHVELKYGENEVFVEISEDTSKFEEAVLATLAHEIAHKYLHINGVSCGIGPTHEYENEVLTDITTIFLGLGKLMLNGCECQNVHQEQDETVVSISNGTNPIRTITETLKVGYLDRTQLAFVYRLVCAMRRIPSTEYERGLSTDAIQSLHECNRHYGNYFNSRFHKPNVRKELVGNLQSVIFDTQLSLFNVDKNLLYIQGACVSIVEDFLEKIHKRLMELLLESQKMVDDNEYDPSLKFLSTTQLEQTITKLVSEVSDYSSETKRYQDSVAKLCEFIQAVENPFPKPSSDMFTIVTCRNDGTKLRLPKDKAHFTAKCPKCQYRFIADTSLPVFKMDSVLKKIFKSLLGRK